MWSTLYHGSYALKSSSLVKLASGRELWLIGGVVGVGVWSAIYHAN